MGEELRAEASRILKPACQATFYSTREEARTLKDLKKEKYKVILTPDKEVSTVVLHRQEYINKAKDLHGGKETYRTVAVDPTNDHKNKLIKILKTVKVEEGIGNTTYKRLYPMGAGPQRSMSYPKSTKRISLLGSWFSTGCSYIWGDQGAGQHP